MCDEFDELKELFSSETYSQEEKIQKYQLLCQKLVEIQTQRHIIDKTILFSPPEFSFVPQSFKILYKSLVHWEAFEKNPNFFKNVLEALEYVAKVKKNKRILKKKEKFWKY
jgi:hypothetical protein